MSIHFILPIFLSFFSGFLSLSQEILWTKLVGFLFFSTPKTFSFVLGCYLIGIALGSLIGKKICLEQREPLLISSGKLFVSAAAIDTISIFAVALIRHDSPFCLIIITSAIIISAALRGAVFPIVHHLGSQNKTNVGTSIANVYSANVFGATLGPLLTGFLLLDYMSLQNSFLFINSITALIGLFCLLALKTPTILRLFSLVLNTILIIIYFNNKDFLSVLMTQQDVTYRHGHNANHIIQNKHGLIHTYPSPTGDIVFGSNLYDGTVNTNLMTKSNKIARAYMIPVLKQDIENVLVIGLSSGAWVRVLTTIPSIKRIDIVEINSGYIDLIRSYPHLSPLLSDPRVHIHIDDGRRWLKRHPSSTFDFILMNTTWHWRNYISNLLSSDFLNIIRHHLTPTGALYYNTTSSIDARYTASLVFPYSYTYQNFVIASTIDIRQKIESQDNYAILSRLNWPDNHKPVFSLNNPVEKQAIDEMLEMPLSNVDGLISASKHAPFRPPEEITDVNMITEYRYGVDFWPSAN